MLKRAALYFGIVLLVVGVLGFIPALAPEGYLFGLFEVGALHNIVHLITGAAAVWVAYVSERASQTYFQIFGVIYAFIALLGLFYGNNALLGIMAHNWADFWLHVVIAAVALYFGFGYRTEEHPVTAAR